VELWNGGIERWNDGLAKSNGGMAEQGGGGLPPNPKTPDNSTVIKLYIDD